jgi:hypothetical protein
VGKDVFRSDRKGFSRLAEGLAPLRMVALSAPIARRKSRHRFRFFVVS